MLFELSRDYKKAWDLIHGGEQLACWHDRHIHKDAAKVSKSPDTGDIAATSNQIICFFIPTDFERFCEKCSERDVEFYLPLADGMIVVSPERLKEITSEVVSKSFQPLDNLIEFMEAIAT